MKGINLDHNNCHVPASHQSNGKIKKVDVSGLKPFVKECKKERKAEKEESGLEALGR